MRRAIRSLPTPLSPVMRTLQSEEAALSALSNSSAICRLAKRISTLRAVVEPGDEDDCSFDISTTPHRCSRACSGRIKSLNARSACGEATIVSPHASLSKCLSVYASVSHSVTLATPGPLAGTLRPSASPQRLNVEVYPNERRSLFLSADGCLLGNRRGGASRGGD